MAEENDGTEEGAEEEVVTGAGNPRDEYRNQLYAKMDEDVAQSGEMTDIPDEGQPVPVDVQPEPAPATPAPVRHTIKVNGQERQVTEEELIALAQKGLGADEKFQQAAELRRQTEERLAQQASNPAPVSTIGDDDRALARAIQMGNEDEAAAVIAQLRKSPSVNDETVRAIDERLSFLQATEKLASEFKDITSDPYLWQLMRSEDEKLVKAGDDRGYWARYQEIGSKLRQHFKLPTPQSQADDKLTRKANITPIPRANVRNTPPHEDDGPENASEVIANMAKKRGQFV